MKHDVSIFLTPIGFVKTSTIPKLAKKRQHLSETVLRPDLTPTLNGLEFSHILVIYWLHEVQHSNNVSRKSILVGAMNYYC
jgi:tRNA (Thr-GGU) A37 N-methylase